MIKVVVNFNVNGMIILKLIRICQDSLYYLWLKHQNYYYYLLIFFINSQFTQTIDKSVYFSLLKFVNHFLNFFTFFKVIFKSDYKAYLYLKVSVKVIIFVIDNVEELMCFILYLLQNFIIINPVLKFLFELKDFRLEFIIKIVDKGHFFDEVNNQIFIVNLLYVLFNDFNFVMFNTFFIID